MTQHVRILLDDEDGVQVELASKPAVGEKFYMQKRDGKRVYVEVCSVDGVVFAGNTHADSTIWFGTHFWEVRVKVDAFYGAEGPVVARVKKRR